MKLKSIEIIQVEGLSQLPDLEFGPGLNIVYGSNGRGKSTLGRLIHDGLFELPGRSRGEAELSWHKDQDESALVRQRLTGSNTPFPFANQRPSAAHAACFFLRAVDLMTLKSEQDPELAALLRRAMAGGVDLEQLLSQNEIVLPRREPKLLAEASQALKESEDQQKRLAHREENLDSLRRRARAAKQAEQELPILENRFGLFELAARKSAIESELAFLPAALQELSERAPEQRRWLEEQKDEAEKSRNDCSRLLRGCRERRETLGPERRILSESQLSELKALKAELSLETRRLAEAEERLIALRGQLRAYRLDGKNLTQKFDKEEIRGLAQAFESHRQFRLRFSALKSLIDAHNRHVAKTRPAVDIENAIAVLRELRPQTAQTQAMRIRAWATVIAMAALIIRVSVQSSESKHLAGYVLIGSLTLLAHTWFLVIQFARQRDRILQRTRSIPVLAGLSDFSPASTTQGLKELQEELGRAKLSEETQRRRQGLILEARELQRSLEDSQRRLDERQRDLGLKVDADLPMLSLAHFDQLLSHQKIVVEYRSAEAQRDRAEDALDSCWIKAEELSRAAGSRLPENIENLESALGRLVDENQLLEALKIEERTLEAELERRQAALHKARLADVEFHDVLGLGRDDEEAFHSLLADLPRFLELQEQRNRLEAIYENARAALVHLPEVLSLDFDSCKERIASANELSSHAEAIREEIASILSDVEQCRSGEVFERRLAARDQARQDLDARRDDAIKAAIKRFILKDLLQDLEGEAQPRVLKRARELFSRFSRATFELLSASGAEFRVRDCGTGKLRLLSELSDGTRLQLLMAARLAFAESVELQEKVPILLDECLINSDPDRFAAVVEVLLQQAEQGRQLIYFSSNPNDVRSILAAAESRPGALAQLLALDPLPISRSAAPEPNFEDETSAS